MTKTPQSNVALAVIIPMYNEEANAERCVRAVCDVLGDDPKTRLFAVNDGSADRTLEILKGLERQGLPFTVVTYEKNRGYGAALVTGGKAALAAGFEFGLFMDSDLTNDPALIARFRERLSEGRWDVVKASRYISGGGMAGVPFRRQIVTRVGNIVASRLFNMGVKDCTNGFRAVRLKLLAEMTFVERGFPQIVEELFYLKRSGARGTEIPYTLTSRAGDGGESKFVYSINVIARYLKYALLAAAIRPYPVIDKHG